MIFYSRCFVLISLFVFLPSMSSLRLGSRLLEKVREKLLKRFDDEEHQGKERTVFEDTNHSRQLQSDYNVDTEVRPTSELTPKPFESTVLNLSERQSRLNEYKSKTSKQKRKWNDINADTNQQSFTPNELLGQSINQQSRPFYDFAAPHSQNAQSNSNLPQFESTAKKHSTDTQTSQSSQLHVGPSLSPNYQFINNNNYDNEEAIYVVPQNEKNANDKPVDYRPSTLLPPEQPIMDPLRAYMGKQFRRLLRTQIPNIVHAVKWVMMRKIQFLEWFLEQQAKRLEERTPSCKRQ